MTKDFFIEAFKENYYGKIIIFIGILLLVPLLVIPFFPSEIKYAPPFLMSAFFCFVFGLLVGIIPRLKLLTKMHISKVNDAIQMQRNQRGSFYVLIIWCYGFIIGAAPFLLSGLLNPVHALFESVSGWTTTGFSVADASDLPHIFLFYRSFMQFCGGLGFIMVIVAFMGGKQSASLYDAENHHDRLMPNLKQTGRIVFVIYGGFLVLGATLYAIFGMKPFDAICHAMTALSTAGHTTNADNIGGFNSFPIELITIILLLIGASNFAVLLLLTKGKIRKIFQITEIKFMLWVLAVFITLMTLSLKFRMDMSIAASLRNALFGVVSLLSTTGFYITDYFSWTPFAFGLLVLLMLIGGGAGSTSGGIKLSRTYYILRITRENIRKRLSPHNKVTTPEYTTVRGKAPIDASLIADTFGFLSCFFGTLIAGTLMLTVTAQCSLQEAVFEFGSALSTTGLTMGITTADANTATLIVQMAGMTLGRLEIYVVFAAAYSGVRRLRGT